MAITVDTILEKQFNVVPNGGYNDKEVEDFLNEIIEEMENRETETNRLKEQVASLTRELDQAKADLAAANSAASSASQAAASMPGDRHSAESFELVLTKAKGAYEEIVAAADARADEIVAKANEEALSMRAKAEMQLTDLNKKLADLRTQASEYCTALKKAMDSHAATMEQIKRML